MLRSHGLHFLSGFGSGSIFDNSPLRAKGSWALFLLYSRNASRGSLKESSSSSGLLEVRLGAG
ncbi:hypothetical protein LINPERHAP1_LOCUS18053 [Linum perenne]